MDSVEIRRRLKQVRRHLADAGADGLVVTAVENVRYLTGFCGHDSWVLVLPRSVVLITDSRYTEQARGECLGCKIVQRAGGLIAAAEAILKKTADVSVVGVEDTCSVTLLKAVRKGLSVKVRPVSSVVEKSRVIKSDAEVAQIAKAGRIAFDAMEWALGQVTVGMTELELTALYEYRLRHYGAAIGFETIVCFGANGSRNHHQPGRKKLRKNDTMLLDFGAKYRGYISDTTRCFAFGTVTPLFRQVYETVANAQRAAIATVRDGARLCEVDAAARAVIAASPFPVYGHGTGHGLGLVVHEAPSVAGQDKKGVLRAGQVITIEPGIYLPGKLGVRLEDDVQVTESGCRLVSRDKRFTISADKVPLLK